MGATKEIFLVCVTVTLGIGRFARQWLFGYSDISFFFALFTIAFVGYQTWEILIYPNFFSPLRHLPHPTDGSFWNGQFSRINKEPSGEPMLDWSNTIPNDGLIYYRNLLNSERVLVTNIKGLSEVLTQKSYDFVKPETVRNGIGRILGVGILLAEGDEHKRQRKLLNPAFTFRHIKDLYPIFWAKSREMVLSMEESTRLTDSKDEKPSNIVDVGKWANRTTLDIIGVAGMGKDFNAIANPSNELYQIYQKIFQPGQAARFLAALNLVLPFWVLRSIPMKRNDDIEASAGAIKKIAYDLIQDKKAKLKSGEADEKDILAVALKSGGFSDEDLVNQLMTFLAAGHETTASSMTWAILLLCQHPDVQTRLREELAAAGLPSMYDKNATVTAADIENIPYLSAVCQEVLRLRPPVAMTLRKAVRDTTILDQHIPKNTTIIMSPLANNHSKEMWGEDAGDFNPDRWMAPGCHNSGGAKSNYAFMTFLHGPRSCIGISFAKAEFMVLLAAWVSSFETELEDPEQKIEIAGGVTSRPKGGLPVRIKPVES